MSPSTTTIQDHRLTSRSGFTMLAMQAVVTLLLLGASFVLGGWVGIILAVLTVVSTLCWLGGYYTLEPNQAAVMSFFGEYVGTVEDNGLRWNNPFYGATVISLRANNFESGKLKVNDLDGNPIEIASVVVWRVEDAASATLAVDDYQNFVHIQAESAVRTLASSYAYDSHIDGKPSMRDNPEEISKELTAHIQERLHEAGIKIVEARISHLAYAPEIAQAMLQRQQASAVVAARAKIVEGAVGMVQMALEKLKVDGTVELDDERKAQMVSNLLVVLCSDRSAQPVVNAGSIHS